MERKDECTRIGDLSGWFVRALITPLGLDKLTDCRTHTQTCTQADISAVKQSCFLSAFSVLYVRLCPACMVCALGRSV